MTTYRASGKYAIDATDAEKIAALRTAIEEASVELVTLGVTLEALEQTHENAYAAAELELEYPYTAERVERPSP